MIPHTTISTVTVSVEDFSKWAHQRFPELTFDFHRRLPYDEGETTYHYSELDRSKMDWAWKVIKAYKAEYKTWTNVPWPSENWHPMDEVPEILEALVVLAIWERELPEHQTHYWIDYTL